MSQLSELIEDVSCRIKLAEEDFNIELKTDENKDYRRGFRAGVLFAYLNIKSSMKGLVDASAE